MPYLWYPLVVCGAVTAFAAMLAAGLPLALSTYGPIAMAALAIVLLELACPERRDWRPSRSDLAADGTFMAVVQLGVPRVLAGTAALAIAARQHADAPSRWWPHYAPLAAQVLLMVLAVDLLRYWLHRACHSWPPLWRLHEVHHSPDLLYTLNVGRFHPLEKSLHFACDTLPFLLLGVAPEVLAGYFLLYAVNGFFQHSNVRLRYGWLNYVIGSAPTHRWHHARDPRSGHCNFGNTTLVWDLAFGTWSLPKHEAPDVGIADRRYPKGFAAQMLAPFRARQARPRSLSRIAADTLVPLALRLCAFVHGLRIARMTRDPMRIQRALLRSILRTNADTAFGREHGFREIDDPAAYARAVPARDFEELRGYVESEMAGQAAVLTRETPLRYLRTSGSTGKPKDVPLTRGHLRRLRRIQRMSVAFQYRACPEAFSGSLLAVVSPAEEGRLPNGRAYGAASGMVAAATPRLVREKFVVPAAVHAITDARLKYLLVLRLALARRDVTYLGAANATTALALMGLFREHAGQLVSDVRDGGFFLRHAVPTEVRAELEAGLLADPRRAAELARLVGRGTPPLLGEVWPRLRLVVTWTCGSAGVSVAALRRQLSPGTRVLELGYVASEFRGTVTVGLASRGGLPTLDSHFFELVERGRWERGEPEYLTLDRLREGREYYVVVTTPSGLYRYFINDIVRVTGFLHATPLLEFVQKGRGVTNLTGEKLYEAHVLEALAGGMAAQQLAARFVIMLADEQACGYRLYVEAEDDPPFPARTLAAEVDARLGALNLEYAAKRKSGRLAPLRAAWLEPGAGERYKAHCVARGQREGQFKASVLACRSEFDFDLAALSREG